MAEAKWDAALKAYRLVEESLGTLKPAYEKALKHHGEKQDAVG